jgi:hypothetical protein
MTRRVPIVPACAAVLALLPACYGSHTTVGTPDAGTDAPTGSCVDRCIEPYVAGQATCVEERRACLLTCSGFEDPGCIDPCETAWDACSYERDYEAERCMEGCPCWEAFMACTEGCEDGPGGGCWAACETDYGTCSGDDITGMGTCTEGCVMPLVSCDEDCRYGSDWEAWVDCTADCHATFTSCIGGCF